MAHLCDILRESVSGGIGKDQGPGFPTFPQNICEIQPSTELDCRLVNTLCEPTTPAGQWCAAQGPGPVQAHVGEPQVEGGAQVIPGSIAYYPCPSSATWFKVQAVMRGCCPPGWSSGHQDYHHQHGCGCGTHPCTC